MSKTVESDSLVTLNYRISMENGQPLISTYEAQPATLQLGAGEMLPTLEKCFVGLEEGSSHHFTLTPDEAFGPHREDLIEVVARKHMPDEQIEPMSVMEFTAPDGSRYSGLVREIDTEKAVIDFNHPLAGKTIQLEVEIIGVL
jgi:FKBP-type peptidyl-prolyl cis-trans isomerase SlpA